MSLVQDDNIDYPKKPKHKNRKKIKTNSPIIINSSSTSPIQQSENKPPIIKNQNKLINLSTEDDSTDLSDSSDNLQLNGIHSYKEKIENRFKTISKRARKSVKKVKENNENKLLSNTLKNENFNINNEIQLVRDKFNLNLYKNKENLNFFLEENIEFEDTTKEITEKSTENLNDTNLKIEFITWPENIRNEISYSEKQLYFKPNGKKIKVEDKIELEEPRYLSEEGLFVPKYKEFFTCKINLLENRLLADDKKWFRCDGELNILPSPIIETSMRRQYNCLPSDETTIYIPPQIEDEKCTEIVVIKENILNINIKFLQFLHHPLFSKEHVFCQKLRMLVNEYQRNIKHNTLQRIKNQIEVLRHLKQKNIDNLEGNSKSTNNDIYKKIKKYTNEIKILKSSLLEKSKNDRELTKNILETWKIIKHIRNENKYSNTNIKLIIEKTDVNYDEDKQQYDKIIEEYFNEKISEIKFDQKKIKRKNKNEDDSDTSSSYDIDEDKIKLNIIKKVKESLKPPGEPLLKFHLIEDNEITKTIDNNEKENLRRNSVYTTKIFLKLLYNKFEVCKTKPFQLNDEFICYFNETISLQLINVSKSITIEIIEQPKGLLKRNIGQIIIDIPSQNVSNKNFKEYYFEKNELIHYKHEGVGSGIKINSLIDKFENLGRTTLELYTSGNLLCNLEWKNIIKDDNSNVFNENNLINDIIDKNCVIKIDKLTEWLNHSKLDPQDPKNSILYDYLMDNNDEISILNRKNNYFRLNPHMKQFQFCNIKEIDDNVRFNILKLRNKNEPEFEGMIVPNRIKEIPINILEHYKKKKETKDQMFELYNESYEYNIGWKNLKQIQINIYQKCKTAENHLNFEDVVNEKMILYFQKSILILINNFLNWFRWKPKLNQAMPKIHKSEIVIPTMSVAAQIIIKINSAFNLPSRDNDDDLQPFIEINYNNILSRTVTKSGQNPIWQEELIFPLESFHTDYLNPNSLSGSIILNVYDEYEEKLDKFDSIKTRRWIGYVEIYLSAICQTSKMEGLFKIKVPNLLLEYEEFIKLDKSPKSSTSLLKTKHCYLDLCLKIEPNIPKLNPSIEELPCNDLPFLKEYILKWNNNYNINYPDRKFSVFVIDINGSTSCLIRYIKPLEPPHINAEGFDVTPDQCLRYISLIPFTDFNKFYQNIWLTTNQFLQLMIGTVIDHAVALTCFLLALKLDVWLVLGYGIPHGFTAFVLEKQYETNNEITSFYIYDVVFGEKFELNSIHSPLHQIYCIINENNIWANIQRTDNILLTRFDFSRRSDWLPLFNNQITAPTNSIQQPLIYKSELIIEDLDIQYEKKIRRKFCKLRPLHRTIWNYQISDVFKNVLKSLEINLMYGKSSYEALRKLKELTDEYILKGHCINLPFTSVSSTMNSVRSFGIHLNQDENVQFGLAIYFNVLPNNAISYWIFIASIIKKTPN